MNTPDTRLAAALRQLTGNPLNRFDTRATITIILTLSIVYLSITKTEIPRELALAYATILGWYFPRPAEVSRG